MATPVRDTRQTILRDAADLFRKQGYGATSMQHVAEACGISKGNLTYHFPSKQALFEAVHQLAEAYVRDRLLAGSFAEAEDTLAGLELFMARVRRWFVAEDGQFVGCLFTNIAVETQHADPEVAKTARGTLSIFKALLAEQLAAGQAQGSVRANESSEALSAAYFWMYEGSLILSRALNDPAEYDAFRAYVRPWLSP